MCASNGTVVSRDAFVLAIVDVQERLAAAMAQRDRVVAAAGRLARCASLVDAPIIVTRQYPKGLGGTVEELEEALPLLEWTARRAARSGVLAEQFNPYTGEPISVSPLTWSHATIVTAALEYVRKHAALTRPDGKPLELEPAL